MKKIKQLIFISLLAIWLSGCTPSNANQSLDNTDNELTENQEANDVNGLNTATPPPFPDLRGSTFDVYLIGGVTDIFEEITNSISDGLEDGFDDLNSRGGVSGAKINYEFIGVRDYEEELVETFLELVEDEDPFLVLLSAPVSQEFFEIINESEVPVLYYGVGGQRLYQPAKGEDYLFWLTPFPDQQMAFVLQEIWKSWDDIRPFGTFNEMKIGYVTWAEEYNHLSLTAQAQDYIEDKNFSLEAEVAIPISANSSVTNFLLDSVANGVTVIFTDTISFGPAVLLNDLHSLGLSDFFVVAGTQWALAENTFEYVRTPLPTDKIYYPVSTAWWTEEDNPAIREAIKIWRRSGRGQEEKSSGYLISLGVVDLVSYVLRLVINEQESDDVSNQLFMDSLSNVEDYSVMDELFIVDYSGGNRAINDLRLWSYSYEEGMTPIGGFAEVPELPPLLEE